MDDDFPPDIVSRLHRDFGERAETILNVLRACRSGNEDYLNDRLARCVIFAASGDETRLAKLLDLWRQDFRDVIVAAEYDQLGVMRLRDFNRPFESADFA